MSAERQREIEEEEAVRADARRSERDRRGVEVAVWILGVIVPAVALFRDWTAWYYWLWVAVGLTVALVLERRRP